MTPPIPLARIEYITCQFNLAHRSMGTELLSVEQGEVTLRLPWRQDLADTHRGLSSLVVTAGFDHACALAALVLLGDEEKAGPTLNLRVDHLEEPSPRRSVAVAAKAIHRGDERTILVQGRAFELHGPNCLLAVASSTVSVAE